MVCLLVVDSIKIQSFSQYKASSVEVINMEFLLFSGSVMSDFL